MTTSRQLAAIMFTDIVGYTALMGRDSAKALELIRISKEIQKPLVGRYNGQWLKEMGDGVLVKFSTATDAINCALEIQRISRADFEGDFRIGIHLGDITVENNDVYGDGVNVASRLESITDPGGIYISESVEKAIRGQTPTAVKYLGEINLKNVNYGVRTYALQGVGLPEPGSPKDQIQKETSTSKGVEHLTKWVAAISTILLLGLIIVYISKFSQIPKDPTTSVVATHLQIALPDDVYLAVDSDYPVLAISPDGLSIVFVGEKRGKRQLYLKELNHPPINVLAGTENAIHPFFSTDGTWIGFIRNTTVMKIPVIGGVPIPVHYITPKSVNRGITWYKEDSLIQTPSPDGNLMISAASGDFIRPLADWQLLIEGEPYYWPQEMSEINSVLVTDFQSNRVEDQNIVLYSLKEKSPTTLINGGSFSRYSRGHILFAREGSLLTTPFEPERKTIVQNEKLIVPSLYTNVNGSAMFAVGGNTLAYVVGSNKSGFEQLVWVDRQGKTEALFSNEKDMDFPRISPDGTTIAITSFDGPNSDLWLLEIERNTFTRLTSHPGEDFGAVWSPDGKQIAFSSEIGQVEEEGPGIAFLDIGSTDPPKKYLSSPGFGYWEFPLSWSPDGKWLLFASTSGNPVQNLEVMSTSMYHRDSLLVTPNSEHGGMFSPNGEWIVYVSDFSGREEVYVRPFLAKGNGKQVSVQGGTEPLWSPDGKEIFYRDYDKFMAVSVNNSTPITLSPPKLLFEGSFKTIDYGGGQANYDISPDGSRFLMINQTSRYRPRVIDVILNWDKM